METSRTVAWLGYRRAIEELVPWMAWCTAPDFIKRPPHPVASERLPWDCATDVLFSDGVIERVYDEDLRELSRR